jgi:hypothetical protein
MFENRVLRRIFGPKRYEMTGGWINQRSEELHNFYSPPRVRQASFLFSYCISYSKKEVSLPQNGRDNENEMDRACSMKREKSNSYRLLWESQKG